MQRGCSCVITPVLKPEVPVVPMTGRAEVPVITGSRVTVCVQVPAALAGGSPAQRVPDLIEVGPVAAAAVADPIDVIDGPALLMALPADLVTHRAPAEIPVRAAGMELSLACAGNRLAVHTNVARQELLKLHEACHHSLPFHNSIILADPLTCQFCKQIFHHRFRPCQGWDRYQSYHAMTSSMSNRNRDPPDLVVTG